MVNAIRATCTMQHPNKAKSKAEVQVLLQEILHGVPPGPLDKRLFSKRRNKPNALDIK